MQSGSGEKWGAVAESATKYHSMGQAEPALYAGYFERSMDVKKRVSVPAIWLTREEGEVFHVVPHPSSEFLMVMPPSEFNAWEQRILTSEATPVQKRMATRKFYSEARTVSTDRQGRILLPEYHCERTGLANDASLIGTGSRFEIWSRERYAAVDPEHNQAYQHVAEIIGL